MNYFKKRLNSKYLNFYHSCEIYAIVKHKKTPFSVFANIVFSILKMGKIKNDCLFHNEAKLSLFITSSNLYLKNITNKNNNILFHLTDLLKCLPTLQKSSGYMKTSFPFTTF